MVKYWLVPFSWLSWVLLAAFDAGVWLKVLEGLWNL